MGGVGGKGQKDIGGGKGEHAKVGQDPHPTQWIIGFRLSVLSCCRVHGTADVSDGS